MERLWSYLRRFSRMTKEMRPSHRQDILSDALQYYSNKVADGLSEYSQLIGLVGSYYDNVFLCTGKSLPLRIHCAVARKNDALKILGSLMSDFHGIPHYHNVCTTFTCLFLVSQLVIKT